MTEVRATTEVPDAPHGAPADVSTLAGGGILALIAGAVGWIMSVRRRISRDNAEITRDHAETDIIKTLREERDKAVEAAEKAWSTRAEDARLIGELTAQVQHLAESNEQLRDEVKRMRAEMQALREAVGLRKGGPREKGNAS